MGIALTAIGGLLVLVGFFACVGVTGNLVLWLKLRKLDRHGVQGEAVSSLHDLMNGKFRVHYRVNLPDGGQSDSFYETQVTEPEPLGSAAVVVYDRRLPRRAKVGTMEAVREQCASEGRVVKWATAFGVSAMALGIALNVLAP
ncbi:hypothetical protein R1T08_21565 [Streptomyces sp. SBC-4]|nr:hypothetical protein [Streptomyces sp. SBC-4]MDV5146705.1 hypothetical protein [Streptomyces sp. SBC-4]